MITVSRRIPALLVVLVVVLVLCPVLATAGVMVDQLFDGSIQGGAGGSTTTLPPDGNATPPPSRKCKISDLVDGFEQSTMIYTGKQAASLGIPLAGSLEGGNDQRVIVRNFIAYRQREERDGTVIREGVGVRWITNVQSVRGKLKLTLPAIAASAEVEGLRAHVLFSVVGAGFPELWTYASVPDEMNVTNFVRMSQNFDKVIELLSTPANKDREVTPQVFARIKPNAFDDISTAQAVTHALRCIAGGARRPDAYARWNGNDKGRGCVEMMYRDLAGIIDDTEEPSELAKKQATKKLEEMGIRWKAGESLPH